MRYSEWLGGRRKVVKGDEKVCRGVSMEVEGRGRDELTGLSAPSTMLKTEGDGQSRMW
jgi:hypothetical protein